MVLLALGVLVAAEGFADGGPSVHIGADDADMPGLGASPGTVRRVSSATPSCVFLGQSSSELLLVSSGVLC